ncbi:unnamed protein product [Arctogadus glacialis]
MESLNSCSDSGCHRTDAVIKKKLKDLLSRAKKDMSAQKNHPTGGGPPPKTSPYSDIIVTIFGDDSPAFVRVDSGCPQPPEPLEEDLASATTSPRSTPPPLEPAVATPSCPMSSPPPATKRRRIEDLQQVLMEKEIIRVEKETFKLETGKKLN